MNPDKARKKQAYKVAENLARRMALRQGLRVVKSRRRDPFAVDFGCYNLVDIWTGRVIQPVKKNGYTFENFEDVMAELRMGKAR